MPASAADERVDANVLVLDDDPDVAGLLSLMLETGGYQVVRAESPDEAERILREGHIELLLLDVNLPGVSGLDFLRMAKQEQPYLEIIMVSGDAQLENAIAFVRAGAFDYLTKPIAGKLLLEKAKAAIEKRHEHLELDLAETAQMLVEESPLAKYVHAKEISSGPICEASLLEHDFKNFLLLSYPQIADISPRPEDCSAIFLRTVERIHYVSHPNIVKLVEHGFQDGGVKPYVVVESLKGRTLREALKDGLPLQAKLKIARQLASALSKMHEASVFIGSFSLDQIMVEDSAFNAKLVDFGLLTFFALEARKLGRGLFLDCSFLAPELLDGTASPDIKSDVFSLAALICYMLAGEQVFPASGAKLARPSLGSNSQKMELALFLLLGAMLQSQPASRPASDEVLSSLNVVCTMPDMLDTVLETYNTPANRAVWS